jgi:peptidoglycan/LPS O-acetylase OafA/YrhL
MRAVKKHTTEPWALLYIERWLKAPIQQEDGLQVDRDRGTPQGYVISPLLANIFLHHAFAKWMQATLASFGSKTLRAVVASRAIMFLSAISYNLYLWHLEIAVWLHNAGFAGPLLYVYSLIASIALARLITYRLEQPLLRTDLSLLIGALRTRLDPKRRVEPLERAA